MGILDDAIRDHLDLKRKHGAPGTELKDMESDAFGGGDRPDPFAPGEPGPAEDPTALVEPAAPPAPPSDTEAPLEPPSPPEALREPEPIEPATPEPPPAEPATPEPPPAEP